MVVMSQLWSSQTPTPTTTRGHDILPVVYHMYTKIPDIIEVELIIITQLHKFEVLPPKNPLQDSQFHVFRVSWQDWWSCW